MLEPKDEGVTHIQRPRPGEFDVVLSSNRARPEPTRAATGAGRMLLYLLVLGVAGWLLTSQLSGSRNQANVPPAPVPAIVEEEPAELPAPAPAVVAQHIDISLPSTPAAAAQPVVATPQPLEKCLKQGNVIDQSVADCRFGEGAQLDTNANAATGMVSAQYMADYKLEQKRPVARHGKPYQVAIVTIREWDGRNAYRAMWRISDNVIDNTSVCGNFGAGSIERRECRRAAEVYFREQCKEWGRRVQNNNDEAGKVAQTRYCTATKTFDPSDG